MISKRLLLSFIIPLLVIETLFYFSPKQSVVRNVSVTPSSIPTNPVLGASSNSSKCHAIQIDTSDMQAFLPDPICTPGKTDDKVTQDNLTTTICHPGYTETVRPPVSYTNTLKKQQIIDYGYEDTNLSNYEEDHFISLERGGSPKDPGNLWPEPHGSPNEKDKVENYLHTQVCSGKITLAEAQQEITKNWYAVYKQLP